MESTQHPTATPSPFALAVVLIERLEERLIEFARAREGADRP